MTTIVAISTPEDRLMVADRQLTWGEMAMVASPKIVRFTHKDRAVLVGTAGTYDGSAIFLRWFEHNFWKPMDDRFELPRKVDKFEALCLFDDGVMELYIKNDIPITLDCPFFAIGTGAPYAMGALEMGAGVNCIDVAAKYDINTGRGTQVETFPISVREPASKRSKKTKRTDDVEGVATADD